MRTNNTDSGSRRRFLLPALLGFLVFAIFSMACHIWPEGHLQSIHLDIGSLEEYCVKDVSPDDPPTTAEADAWIEEALWNNGHAQDWNIVVGIHQFSFGDCEEMDFQQMAEVDIYYELATQNPGCSGGSCLFLFDVINPHNGHNNFKTVNILLVQSDITGTDSFRRHVINHETGHAYGLDDPVEGQVTNSYRDCWMGLDLDGDGFTEAYKVFSIMHNSGHCEDTFPDFPWPTDCDLRIVTLIAEQHPFAITEDPADYKGGLCDD